MMTSLTLRDVEMLRTAVMEQAGNVNRERDEDRWLSLEHKLARIRRQPGEPRCRCGHARDKHRYATDITSTCRICHCQSFDARLGLPVPVEATDGASTASGDAS